MKKIICPPGTALAKHFVAGIASDGEIPNGNTIDQLVDHPSGAFAAAKQYYDLGGQFISHFTTRPSERLNKYLDGEMIEILLDAYADFEEQFYNRQDESTLIKIVKDNFKYDFSNKKFKDESVFKPFNGTLEQMPEFDRKYFHQWMEYLHTPKTSKDPAVKFIQKITQNMRENFLVNSISGAALNGTQLTQTVLPRTDLQDIIPAFSAWNKDRKNGFAELNREGIAEKTAIEDIKKEKENTKFDLFLVAEKLNQGFAYFAGKQRALREGKSEEQAIKAGKVFNEEVNYISRSGNQPMAYWSPLGRSGLSLLTYTIQNNKMHMAHWDNLVTNRNSGLSRADSASFLLKHVLYNAPVVGASGVIPVHVWATMMFFDENDEIKEFFYNLDKNSLYQLVGLDVTRQTRQLNPSFGPVSLSTYNQMINNFVKVGERISKNIKDEDYDKIFTDPKNWNQYTKALKSGSIFLPWQLKIGGVKIGNGQTFEAIELAQRLTQEYYDRWSWETKQKYETDWAEEVYRATLGLSTSESAKIKGIK